MNGIILAGGKNSRFGENKAFIKIEDNSLIERSLDLLRKIFHKVYVVTNSASKYQHLPAEIIVDKLEDCGPMGGIHAGLIASDSHHNFVVACDMPFLNPELISYLMEKAENSDIFIPHASGKLQMLHAFYSKNCITKIEEQIKQGDLQLKGLLKILPSQIIDVDKMEDFDPLWQKSFSNINTQEDYESAREQSVYVN